MVRCPNIDEDTGDPCGLDLQLRDRFCSQCGWKIDRKIFLSPTCPALLEDGSICATALPPKCKFCPGCGSRVRYRDQQDSATITPSTSVSISDNLATDVSSSFTFQSQIITETHDVSQHGQGQSLSRHTDGLPQGELREYVKEKYEDLPSQSCKIDSEAKPSLVSVSTAPSGRKITTVQLQLSAPPVSVVQEKEDVHIKQIPASHLSLQRCTSVPATSSDSHPDSDFKPMPDFSEKNDSGNDIINANNSQKSDKFATVSENKISACLSDGDGQTASDIIAGKVEASVCQVSDKMGEESGMSLSSIKRRMSPHASPKRPPPAGPGPIRAVHGLQGPSERSNSQKLSEAHDKLRKFGKGNILRKSHSMDDLSTIESVTESSIPCINIGDKKPKSIPVPKRSKKTKGKSKKTSSKKIGATSDGATPQLSVDGKGQSKKEAPKDAVAMETCSDSEGESTYFHEDTDHTSVDTVTEWTEASVSQPPEELPQDDAETISSQPQVTVTSDLVPEQEVKVHQAEQTYDKRSGTTEEKAETVGPQKETQNNSSGQHDGQSAEIQSDQQTDSNGSSGQSADKLDDQDSKETGVGKAGEESEEESSGLISQSKGEESNGKHGDSEDGKKKKKKKDKKEKRRKRGKSGSEASAEKKVDSSESVMVSFHVLLSPEFSINIREDKVVIRFDSSVLGGWEGARWPMQFVKELPDKFKLLRGEHRIPWYLLYNKTLEYKYVVTGASRQPDGEYEFLYKKPASGKSVVNRELTIPKEKCRVGGKFHQYDSVIYPQPEQGILDKVKQWLGVSSDQHKKLSQNARRSLLAMLPRWEGFVCNDGAESGSAWDMIQELEHVINCLSSSFVTEKLDTDSSQIKKVLLEYLEPKLNSFEKLKNIIEESAESASVRIASALATTVVIQKYQLPVTGQHLTRLFEALLIRPNVKQKVCHELRAVVGHFPVERGIVVQALISLCNLAIGMEGFLPKWLYAVPILHFLRGDSMPFTESDLTYNLNNERWWGIQALEHRIFRNSANIDTRVKAFGAVMERLAPLFSVDVLLPRTIISLVSLRHLEVVVKSRAFQAETCCALLHVMVSAGVVTLQDKERQILQDAMEGVALQITQSTDELIQSRSEVGPFMQQMRVASEIAVSLVELTLSKVTAQQHHLVVGSVQVFMACMGVYKQLHRHSSQNKQTAQSQQSVPETKLQIIISTLSQWLKKHLPASIAVTRSLTPTTATTEMTNRRELEIWSQLLNMKLDEESWEKSWKESLLLQLQARVSNMDDRKKIELFCQEDFSQCNKDVEECFSKAAFAAVDTATFLFDRIGGQIDDTVMKYGVMMSVLFESRWPKDIDKLPDFKKEQELLRHMLMWSTFPRYLELFVGKSDKCAQLLSKSCCQHLAIMMSLYDKVTHSLLRGSIQLQTLRLILEFSDNFLGLCKSIESCKSRADDANQKEAAEQSPRGAVLNIDQISQMLDCRRQEVGAFETECKQVSHFLTMCSHIQPVQTENLKMKLAKDLTYHTLDDICEPITSGEIAVLPKVEPKVTYFSIKQELKRMFHVLSVVSQSILFTQIWEEVAQRIHKEKEAELGARYRGLTVEDIFIVIWLPVHSTWVELGTKIDHGTITLAEVDKVAESVEDNYEALVKEFRLFGMDQAKVDTRIYQVKQYRKLNQHFNGAHIFMAAKRAFKLTGDFQDIEGLIAAGDAAFRKQPLSCITKDLVRAGQAVSVLTEDRAKCIGQLVTCMPLVEWLQTAIRNTRELKVFVDLASISAGEGDMSVDRVSCLHSAATGYAPLIYDLPKQADFLHLLKQCEVVWKTLETDPSLPDKLEGAFRHLDWFRSVKDTHGSVEMSTLSQVRAINTRGIFRVGNVKKDAPKTMERVISLTVPPVKQDTDKMVYTFDQLNDLQSKLMLVAGKAEKSRQDVERFVEIFDGVKRLADAYIHVCVSGNVLFNQWKVTLYCDPERPINTVVDFGLLEQKKLKGQGNRNGSELSRQVRDLCEFMEKCYDDWLKYISEKRDQFSHLNYFTTEQLVILRQELAKVGVQDTEASKLVYPLLSVIKEDCTEEQLYVAKETAFEDLLDMETLKVIDEMENSNKDKKQKGTDELEEQKQTEAELVEKFMAAMRNSDFSDQLALRALKECGAENIDDGIIWCMDHVTDSDESEDGDRPVSDDDSPPSGPESPARGQNGGQSIRKVQLTSTIGKVTAGLLADLQQKEKKDLKSQLESLWQEYLTSVLTSSLQDFLSVQHLGLVLQHLAAMATQPPPRPLPDFITPGQPNLIVCPRAETLKTALSLYMQGPDLPLPSPSEVLVCSEHTTDEEIELLWKRAASDTLGRIYCMLNADNLDYDVSVKAERSLETLIQTKSGYRVVIICSSEREDTCNLVTSLDHYQVSPPQPPSLEDIQFYLHVQFQVHTKQHGINPAADLDPERSSVRIIQSGRAGLGKSLYKERLNERLLTLNLSKHKDMSPLSVTIPLQEHKVNRSAVLMSFLRHTPNPKRNSAKIFHIDIANEVQEGVDDLLFNLLILGQLTDCEGYVWKRSRFDLYLIEVIPRYGQTTMAKAAKKTRQELLHNILPLLPTVTCYSPQDVLGILQDEFRPKSLSKFDPLMDEAEFHSPVFQRPYQYLKRAAAGNNLDQFIYVANHIEGSPAECLELLLRHCGVKDPSWAELRHFVWFLNVQLQDCEKSTFTDYQFVGDILQGFFNFVVTFMVAMSKDFATRSLNMSEETPQLWQEEGDSAEDWETEDEEDMDVVEEEAGIPELARFQLKRKWENSPHPYIFFNSDHQSFTFLGFNIDPRTGDLIDPVTQEVLEQEVMPAHLQQGLLLQRVRLHEHFDELPRHRKIEKLCNVMGLQQPHDPDESYEITADNAKKILAIHMRFRCGIPVIIMGETGCGKTRLIRFMCALQAPPVDGQNVRNLEMMKVHGGSTARDIVRKVKKAEELARNNRKISAKIDTVLFFDETNTTESIGLIKEIMCDKTMNGESLDRDCGLKLIAACNPYRKHSDAMIGMLEQAGLGYHVRAEKTADRMGLIPMRHLVYRVQPLPPSVLPLVWDFGQLAADVEEMYIRQIVHRYIENDILPGELGLVEVVSSILAASQRFMREQKDECSFVSLRDVERCMNVMAWFYSHRRTLFLLMDKLAARHKDQRNQFTADDSSDDDEEEDEDDADERLLDDVTRSLVLALGVCYHACLQDTPREVAHKEHNTRAKYRKAIAAYFDDPCDLPGGSHRILDEISRCQDVFLQEIHLGPNIARNQALKENVFMMVVCIELRIPLFLVGKPGSSKSLAKTIVADAMQGLASPSRLFKSLKQVHMVSYQCSPLSTPDGIVGIFRQCAQFQQGKNLDQFVSCVVLDEVGLAEDSPRMPLKTLHPLLEDGCEGDEEPAPHKKVAFIGISNWALDPAKMNRGILVQRGVPDEQELVHSATGICMSGKVAKKWIDPLILPMSQAYLDLYNSALQIREFFGLRDFYSLVKMVFNFAKKSKRPPSWSELVHAIKRNFGGLELVDPVQAFDKRIHMDKKINVDRNEPDCSEAGLIRASLAADTDAESESRYLLILTENYSALPILRQFLLHKDAIVIFGSSFPKDQQYTQVCRNINRIKVCMETGRTVVLLNMESLYESLYDALNQYYVWFGGQRYVDLGLGTHRVKCRVHDDFRLVVVAEKRVVYDRFPIPLINRLEKHFLATDTVLSEPQRNLVERLRKWADDFATITMARHIETRDVKPLSNADAFIGYHNDTPASVVLQVWRNVIKDETAVTDEQISQVFAQCKSVLLRCAAPDAVARLGQSRLMTEAGRLWDQYFNKHKQDTLASYLKHALTSDYHNEGGLLAQVTTHSRLLSMRDMQDLSKALGMPRKNMILMALQALDTEQQFSRKIRDFLGGRSSERLLIIQCDSGDVNSDLIACAKYCVEDEYTQSRASMKGKGHVVFLIQLPRMAGGCFLGFTGGWWQCAHIDELHTSQSIVTSITDLKNKPISAVLEADIKAGEIQADEKGVTKPPPDGSVNVSLLLKSCIQAAVAMLNDGAEDTNRAAQRIHILLNLISSPSKLAGSLSFLQIMKHRVCDLQKDKEDTVTGQNIANNWLCSEAASVRNIHNAGTLRRAVVQYLESRYTPLLAGVIAYTDRNRNLDLMVSSPDGHWVRDFWMDMIARSEVTVLEYRLLQSPKSRTELTRIPVTGTGYQGRGFTCHLPFSWVIKEKVDAFIQTVTTVTGKDPHENIFTELKRQEEQVTNLLMQGPMGEILTKVQTSGHQGELLHRYLLDFIYMVCPVSSDSECKLIYQSLEAAGREVAAKSGVEPVDDSLTIPSMHLIFLLMKQRLQVFSQILQLWPEAVQQLGKAQLPKSEMTLDVMSIFLVLEHLRPEKDQLNHSDQRAEWLESVALYRPVIERVLFAAAQNSALYGEISLTHLKACRYLWTRICAVQLFVEHVCPAGMKEEELGIKRCMPLWTYLGDEPDFKTEGSMKAVEKFLKACNATARKHYFGMPLKKGHVVSHSDGRITEYKQNQPVLIKTDFGVWWPGFIIEKDGRRYKCGYFNDNILLSSFNERKKGATDLDLEMTRELTSWEQHLLESQEVMETRGKRGKCVPVIIPSELQEHMQYLVNPVVRNGIGIHPENKYIFAAPGQRKSVLRAYESLSKISSEAGLKKPERITSVYLRKYMATVSQVINMTSAEEKWLFQHLGHTEDIHMLHYRSRSDVIERVEIAKLCLMQDNNLVHKFVGKRLEDIQFDELVYMESDLNKSVGKKDDQCSDIVNPENELYEETEDLSTLSDFEDDDRPDVSGKRAMQKCCACTEQLQDPVQLPCGHSCCTKCVLQLQSLAENECPECQLPFPAGFTAQPQAQCKEAVQQHQQYRRRCNAFFMELVSRLCFADGSPPEPGVITMLMNLIIGEAKSKKKKKTLTMQMSVFDDCIDTTPVVRSFLLQLLLRSRMELVYDHLQNYFERVREMADDTRQVVELCILCVQCMEDSYYTHASVSEHDNAQYGQVRSACEKLQQVAPFHATQDLNMQVLQQIAMTTFGLTVVAQVMHTMFRANQEEDAAHRRPLDENVVNRLLAAARRLCEKCGSKWPRLYLVKQLCRRYGQDCFERIAAHRHLQWIVPEDMMLARQDEDVVDRYIVCGEFYREIRDMLARFGTGNRNEKITAILQHEHVTDEVREVSILLALYREVTSLHSSQHGPSPATQQTLNNIQEFIRSTKYIRQKRLAELLIQNQQGGKCTQLIVQPGQSAFHRGVASLIVHTHLVLSALDKQKLAHPLLKLMADPQSMQNCLLPTMPQDELIDAREAALAARTDMENPVFYQCPNGHMYMIGNCGRPFYQGFCPVCRCRIGGNAYVLARGNAKASLDDETMAGHCLGDASQRTLNVIGQREMTASSTSILRLLCHMSMILGSTHDPRSVSRMVQPRIASADVFQFLWEHITFDIESMSHVLGRSQDDCMLLMHLLLHNMLTQRHLPRGITRLDVSLMSKESRLQWESLFSKAYITPILSEGLDARLHDANHLVVNDDRMGANGLMKLIFEVDSPEEEVDLNQIWEVPAMWRYRARVTVEHLTQEVQENIASVEQQEVAAPPLQLLNLFLQQEHILQCMHLLPAVVRLQWLLRQQFQHNLNHSEASAMTVCEFLRDRAGQGAQKAEYESPIQSFSQAWNSLKKLLLTPVGGGIKVPAEYCDLSITDNTKISMLLPSRRGFGVCSLALVDFLIVTHNDFMEQYYRMKGRNFDTVSLVDVKELTPAHLICIQRDGDLLPAILSHCSYSLEVGQGTVVHYDLPGLQQHLDNQFFSTRPFIRRQVELMVYRDDSSNTAIFDSIRQKIPQESLNAAVQRQIQSELRLQTDVHDGLNLLYVVMNFLTSIPADPDMLLTDFVKKTLSMDLKIASQKAQQSCQLKHLLSLWLLLSVERAKLLINNQQDAFENIGEDYHESLSAEQCSNLQNSLRHTDTNTLLMELYECIIFRITQGEENTGADEPTDNTGFRLRDTLMAYTFEKDGPEIPGIDSLPEDILNKHAVDTWKQILRFCQKTKR